MDRVRDEAQLWYHHDVRDDRGDHDGREFELLETMDKPANDEEYRDVLGMVHDVDKTDRQHTVHMLTIALQRLLGSQNS